MKTSMERSHHKTDIDQANAEHFDRERSEGISSYADLRNTVPFRGNSKDLMRSVKELKAMIDELPSDGEQADAAKEAREKLEETFRKIESRGSFGKGSSRGEELPPSSGEDDNKDDFDRELSEISATF